MILVFSVWSFWLTATLFPFKARGSANTKTEKKRAVLWLLVKPMRMKSTPRLNTPQRGKSRGRAVVSFSSVGYLTVVPTLSLCSGCKLHRLSLVWEHIPKRWLNFSSLFYTKKKVMVEKKKKKSSVSIEYISYLVKAR